MNYFVFLGLLFALFSSELNAQTVDRPGVIEGTFRDSTTGKPVSFATVSLFQKNKLIDGTLTDSLGHFALKNLAYGTYRLAFSAVGYRSFQIATRVIDAQTPALNLGTLAVSPDVKTLQTVTVRGQKPLIEMKADGLTFNVESLPPIAGASAADILRRVPLLSVDANGGLSMRGSSQIRVFIDGKPSDIYASSVADALKSINGENIVKVEVITHPSARYDAEGTDGVVNITTRKSRTNATNGNLGVLMGNRSANVMGDVQHKRGKWLLKADGYYQIYRNRNGAVLERKTEEFRIVQKSESRQTGAYLFGGANVIYSLDSNNTLNAGYRLRWSSFLTHAVSDNFYTETTALVPTFRRNIDTPNDNGGSGFNLGYTGTSNDKKKEFSLLGTYFLLYGTTGYDLRQPVANGADYRENYTNKNPSRDLTLQADYSQSFNDHLKWETGGKLIRKSLKSSSQFGIYNAEQQGFSNDPTRSNEFSYQSSIYALYTSFNIKVNKWQFIAGARYEKTDLKATFKETSLRVPSFDNLVPNLLISRNLSQKSTLKLGYTLKLARPYITYLNPTVNNSDSLNVQFGNPYLRPEITRRFQLSYSRNGAKVFMDYALFYNHNNNSIENIRTARPDGIFETTWKNIGRNRRLGLSTNLNWKPSSKLSLAATLTIQQVWLESRALGLSNQGLMREFVPKGSYSLPKGFSIDFYGFFDARNIRLQGYRSGWKFYSMTVNKKSKNERFNMSLRVETFLKPHTFIQEETTTDAFQQIQTYRYQNQNIRFIISHKLGKKEIKGPRVRQAENPD